MLKLIVVAGILTGIVILLGISFVYAQSIDVFSESAKSWVEGKISNSLFLESMNTMYDNGTLKRYPISQNTFFVPQKGESINIQIDGRIEEFRKSGVVTLVIIHPDASITKSSARILESGRYETTLVFDSTASLGTYKVMASFEEKNLEPSYFTITKKTHKVPTWFKETTRWWIERKMQDYEYIFAIQYLINHRIIIDDVKTTSKSFTQELLSVKVSGQQMIRRGTTQEITIQVSDNGVPVNGAQVFIRIENYDEDVLREYNGYTDSSGIYKISWETDKNVNDYNTMLAYIDVTDGNSVITKLFKFIEYCLPGEKNCKIRGN